MPVATAVPAKNVVLRFPRSSDSKSRKRPAIDQGSGETDQNESYQLLELPAEILKQVDGGKGPVFPLTIKGRPGDDAVLCTSNSTFLLRTVTVSNSLLVCRDPETTSSPSDSDAGPSRPTLEIRDICHAILEPLPHAPNLERIRTILRPSAWKGLGEDAALEKGRGKKRRRAEGGEDDEVRRYTRAQLESVIQASDAELEKGLRERNVVEVEGQMIILPTPKLAPLLSILLTLLTIHSSIQLNKPTGNTPTAPIMKALEEDHDVPASLGTAVLTLFGKLEGGIWEADTSGMVREIGKGMLESVQAGKSSEEFLNEWKAAVGESWEELVDISLLEGNYLLDNPPPSALRSSSQIITYFPSHTLPLHPATRFADLFLTRPRWRPGDMAPFLRGLTREGDTKERDKLVAKFVRVVKEKEGVWWYPRRTG